MSSASGNNFPMDFSLDDEKADPVPAAAFLLPGVEDAGSSSSAGLWDGVGELSATQEIDDEAMPDAKEHKADAEKQKKGLNQKKTLSYAVFNCGELPLNQSPTGIRKLLTAAADKNCFVIQDINGSVYAYAIDAKASVATGTVLRPSPTGLQRTFGTITLGSSPPLPRFQDCIFVQNWLVCGTHEHTLEFFNATATGLNATRFMRADPKKLALNRFSVVNNRFLIGMNARPATESQHIKILDAQNNWQEVVSAGSPCLTPVLLVGELNKDECVVYFTSIEGGQITGTCRRLRISGQQYEMSSARAWTDAEKLAIPTCVSVNEPHSLMLPCGLLVLYKQGKKGFNVLDPEKGRVHYQSVGEFCAIASHPADGNTVAIATYDAKAGTTIVLCTIQKGSEPILCAGPVCVPDLSQKIQALAFATESPSAEHCLVAYWGAPGSQTSKISLFGITPHMYFEAAIGRALSAVSMGGEGTIGMPDELVSLVTEYL